MAKRAKVSLSTVRDFEARKRTPIENNRLAMEEAFRREGIECMNASAVEPRGIRTVG